MAEDKSKDPVAGSKTETSEEGVGARQVEPITDRSKEQQQADLLHPEDIKKGVLKEPQHDADKTPYPVGEQPPIERPPFSTGRPDVPIVQSAVTGAGAHTPPDPDDYTPDGRLRDLQGE
jgi:hypothetical protein